MNRPFEIFGDYLDDIINYIKTQPDFTIEESESLIKTYKELSYDDVINFKYSKYFKENGQEDFYNSKLKGLRDDFDDKIQHIQDKLKINKTRRFDEYVKINVNIFKHDFAINGCRQAFNI